MLEILGFFALLYLICCTDFGAWVVAFIIATVFAIFVFTLVSQWLLA